MSDKAKEEFSLDQFSETETDEEFGLPEFKEHFADTLTPAVLRDWTAKDFASIYVRFRPHLERHAKRFLRNPSHVEEVIQDAFLYLMTALPELDSELGVLRFLKWKVRLLSYDVARAESRVTLVPIDEMTDSESDEPAADHMLERAEDAAIVSIALAKLQPRHREALIASIYEEKSTADVANQLGLSQNAFRQLLFRARASFKRALVGEADLHGKTVSEILSVAARVAAKSPTTLSILALFGLLAAAGVLSPRLEAEPLLSESTVSIQEPPSSRVEVEQFLGLPFEDAQESPNQRAAGQVSETLETEPNGVQTFVDSESLATVVSSEDLQITENNDVEYVNSDSFLDQERLELSKFLEDNVPGQEVFRFTQETALAVTEGNEVLDRLEIQAEFANSAIFVTLDPSEEGSLESLSVLQRSSDGSVETALVPRTVFLQRVVPSSENQFREYEFWASGFYIADLSGQFSNVVDASSKFSNFVLSGTLKIGAELSSAQVSFILESRDSFLAKAT